MYNLQFPLRQDGLFQTKRSILFYFPLIFFPFLFEVRGNVHSFLFDLTDRSEEWESKFEAIGQLVHFSQFLIFFFRDKGQQFICWNQISHESS